MVEFPATERTGGGEQRWPTGRAAGLSGGQDKAKRLKTELSGGTWLYERSDFFRLALSV